MNSGINSSSMAYAIVLEVGAQLLGESLSLMKIFKRNLVFTTCIQHGPDAQVPVQMDISLHAHTIPLTQHRNSSQLPRYVREEERLVACLLVLPTRFRRVSYSTHMRGVQVYDMVKEQTTFRRLHASCRCASTWREQLKLAIRRTS